MPSVDSDNSRSNLLVSLAPSPCNPKGRQDRQSAGGSGMDARGSGISVLLARSPSAQKGGKTKKALDAMAWMQEAGPAQHLYFCSAEHNRCSGQLTARDTNKFDLNRVKRVPVFAKKKPMKQIIVRCPPPPPSISMLIGLCCTSAEAVRKKSRFL